MDIPPSTLRLLSSRQANPMPRRLEAGVSRTGLGQQPVYGRREIRRAIRDWYELPDTLPIKMDLRTVYPWLGKEYQDVFDLYALGFSLKEIDAYWHSLHNLHPTRLHEQLVGAARRRGDNTVYLLLTRLLRLLRLTITEISLTYPEFGRPNIGKRP